MNQLSLWSGTDTPVKSSENEQQTDGSLACKCGKGMSDCSIHPNTPDEWIASMRASLARILASPVIKQELARKREAAFTVKSSASLAWFDLNTSSWKTSQQSLLTDSEPSLVTWPRSGMTANGYAYELPIVGRITIGTDGGYWPTPDTRGFVNEGSLQMLAKNCNSEQEFRAMAYRASISKKTKYWPTPTAHDAKDTGSAPSEGMRNTPNLAYQAGGKLNPQFVEFLMGFPIGFTNSKDWVTRKCRSNQQSPSQS